ncbi:hypothetical protein SDC9_184652 [bioreactor metagenome]|uniref:Uncharacterized protein n=1 Tax=bioreactor metagenome TaxID=1076179 RepID=A0A645HF03_9ZZZZ
MHPGVHRQVDDGHQGGDEDDEDRNAHLVADRLADDRDQDVGHHQYRRRCQPHAQAVGAAGGYRHGRTQRQHLGEDDVLLPEAVLDDGSVVVVAHDPLPAVMSCLRAA